VLGNLRLSRGFGDDVSGDERGEVAASEGYAK
jgi:hypothetical protein